YLYSLENISKKNQKKPIILFFGRHNFSDNSKYLFLNMSARQDVLAIWCSTNAELCTRLADEGLQTLNMNGSIGHILSIFTQAAVAVHCVNTFESVENTILRAALKGAVHIQLWHGISIKPLDMLNANADNLLDITWIEQTLGAISIDATLSPAERLDHFWRAAFGTQQVIRAGLPRNEVLLRPATESERINTANSVLSNTGNYILWVPTFTSAGMTPLWNRPELINQLVITAQANGYQLVIKPHPYDTATFHSQNIQNYDDVIFISPDIDIYPDLHKFSCLITDCSSLMFDYLHLDRPILILEHSQKGNDTQLAWFDHLPLPAVIGPDTNAEALLEKCLKNDQQAQSRKKCVEALFTTDALTSCKTISKVLYDLVEKQTENKFTVMQ
ncbi:MAG: CDP-glycerol glycerophosphotransferase family protein, partial [Acetobacter sp.]|uniref:CDP-glycerol glycerophosphotransferase family protein n=1 Tax=Acetobacter sp. TaxID=440 RepID=UPI0039E7437F